MAVILVAGIAVLALIVILSRSAAQKAEATGELRFRVRSAPGEQLIKRSEEPERFARELMLLRALPWIAAAMTSFVILLLGMFL